MKLYTLSSLPLPLTNHVCKCKILSSIKNGFFPSFILGPVELNERSVFLGIPLFLVSSEYDVQFLWIVSGEYNKL